MEPSPEPERSSETAAIRSLPRERRRRKLVGVVLVATLVALTIISLSGNTITAPRYNDAQRASSVHAFQLIVSRRAVGDFRLAAYYDLAFALGYGLLAIVALGWFAKRSGQWKGLGHVGHVGHVGCIGVFVAALFDEAENLMLLRNLSNRDAVSESAIDAMTGIGLAKWICVFPALLAVSVGLLLVCVERKRERSLRSG
jgi:hypothetical protein